MSARPERFVARRPRPRTRHQDDGSALVEFVFVVVVLLAVFLAVLQVGLVLFVRNTLVACAADGARYGANADRSAADGADRARTLVSDALSPRFARDVSSGYETRDGVATVYVQVRASVPLVGYWGPAGGISLVLRGHALREGAG